MPVSNYCNFIIECNNSYFTIRGSISHVDDLLVDSCLQALHAAYISDLFFLVRKKLLRSIWKFHKFLHFSCLITFELKFTLNWLRRTHWSWLINTKNDRNFFFAHYFFVLNLCSSLYDIIDSFTLWFFFLFQMYFIINQTKLTGPCLLANISI